MAYDEIPMQRDGAIALLGHLEEQWATPLTFDERQVWGKTLLNLDLDYAVAAFTAAKIALPDQRPSVTTYYAIYEGVMDEANQPVEPQPEPTTEGDPMNQIEKIRQQTGMKRGGSESQNTGSRRR